MSHIKHYIEKSLLIPPDAKKTMIQEDRYAAMEEKMACFLEKYAPIEKEILEQVNKELEMLTAQIRNYLKNKEGEIRVRDAEKIEQELAYL